MKSVCLVVQNSYPADVRIRKYAQTLSTSGYKVFVIACRMPGQAYHECIDGVEVFRIPPSRSRAGKLRYVYEYGMFLLLAFVQLNILDIRLRFDVVHVNTLPDFLVFCAFIQKLAGRTVILDMHEVMPEFFMSKYSSDRDSRLVKALLVIEKLSMRFADRVITVNHSLKRLFETRVRPRESVEVIMNTADSRVLQRYEKRPHSTFNCVYHGTVTEIYGVDLAIEGFVKACAGEAGMMCHIFGDGPHVSQLEKLVKRFGMQDQVLLHGAVPFNEMWEKLAEMDLGILACRRDIFTDLSFSNKLAEYVYLKIPVIHSDLTSIQYYFNDDEITYFKAGDTSDLAEKIRYACDNREAIAKKAEAAFLRYSEIEWGTMSRRYLELIQKSA